MTNDLNSFDALNPLDKSSGSNWSGSKNLVRGAVLLSVAVGLGLLLVPLVKGVLDQRRLLRRPMGRVVKTPFAIEVDQTPAYD